MEGLTRLVSESLARHGFDRPLDYRRLHWSRWFRCESHHSLLFVPSKPGVFAVAEEIMDLDSTRPHVGTDAFVRPATLSEAKESAAHAATAAFAAHVETAASAVPRTLSEAKGSGPIPETGTPKPEPTPRRMLAVTQFFEDDDMAFVLDRMLSTQNPMRARLASGRYFVRFVVIEDQSQRRTICNALNQWMVTAAEKATGIGSHFATSLELTSATEYVPAAADAQQPLFAGATGVHVGADAFVRPAAAAQESLLVGSTSDHVATAASAVPRSEASGSGAKRGFSASAPVPAPTRLDPGAATNIHHPNPFPSGF